MTTYTADFTAAETARFGRNWEDALGHGKAWLARVEEGDDGWAKVYARDFVARVERQIEFEAAVKAFEDADDAGNTAEATKAALDAVKLSGGGAADNDQRLCWINEHLEAVLNA